MKEEWEGVLVYMIEIIKWPDVTWFWTAVLYYFISYFNRIGVLFGIYYYLTSLFTRTCCDPSGKFLDSTLFNALSCVFKVISSMFYSFLVYLNMHDCNHKEFFLFGKRYKMYDKLQSHFVRKRILHYTNNAYLHCHSLLYAPFWECFAPRSLFIWIYSKDYSRVITYTINANERFGGSILIWTKDQPYMEVNQVKKSWEERYLAGAEIQLLKCPLVPWGIVTTHYEKLRTSIFFKVL